MRNLNAQSQLAVLGTDLAKTPIRLCGVDAGSNIVIRKKLSRKNLVQFIAQLLTLELPLSWIRLFRSG